MKVKDLITQLQRFSPNEEIFIEYSKTDYLGTVELLEPKVAYQTCNDEFTRLSYDSDAENRVLTLG